MTTKARNVEAGLPMFGMLRVVFDYIFNSPLCVHFDQILIVLSKMRRVDSLVSRERSFQKCGRQKQINTHKKNPQYFFSGSYMLFFSFLFKKHTESKHIIHYKSLYWISSIVIHLFMPIMFCVCVCLAHQICGTAAIITCQSLKSISVQFDLCPRLLFFSLF